MKNQLIFLALFACSLNAASITLTPEQEANWQIKTEIPEHSEKLPLGEFIAEVVTPPSLLHTVALPFEATVQRLNVAKYEKVDKGQTLAEMTGTAWIETQEKAIADEIQLRQHAHLAERKNILCREEVIPKKECVAANAELETDRTRVSASKALLKSYGASDAMIETLFQELSLSPTIEVKSSVMGSVVQLYAAPGKSTNPGDALFVIQKEGALWLESAIVAKRTEGLEAGQKVEIVLGDQSFDSTILQLSPVINYENQTREIRFLLPSGVKLFPGLRSSAKIILLEQSLKITKNAVIKVGEAQVVFYKDKQGYTPLPVEILSEDDTYYFVKPSPLLKNEIAVSSVAILKSMMESDDE
ncbi:MAG TPA: efflux RND transporter periplasmic adaptor subunit [Sulfurovum sp.]|uniref:efflux RND transporter periplasmic adaptor subunit n=1 Tax=Sulfurovum sp. TaxID=1969726 RepID=UPI002F95DC0F